MAHGVQQSLWTNDVEEGVLLAGERRLWQVLGGRARSHRNWSLSDLLVRRQDVPHDLWRKRSTYKGLPNGNAAALLFAEHLANRLAQVAFRDEAVVGCRGHNEARWYWEAGADQLAQVGALATRHNQIPASENMQRKDEQWGIGGDWGLG